MATSSAFERFRSSCFGKSFHELRDGLDAEAAKSLSGEDRAKAVTLILEALTETKDSRPFIAAGAMGIEEAVPLIKARLRSGCSLWERDLKVHAAHALYLLEKWSDASATILGVLKRTWAIEAFQWPRMMAVDALGDFADDPRAHAGLFVAVEDKDEFVGFLAIQSLKKLYSGSGRVMALLEMLRKTQLEGNRWDAGYLQQRQRTLRELEVATGIRMPRVAMKSPVRSRRRRLMLVGIGAALFFIAVLMKAG